MPIYFTRCHTTLNACHASLTIIKYTNSNLSPLINDHSHINLNNFNVCAANNVSISNTWKESKCNSNRACVCIVWWYSFLLLLYLVFMQRCITSCGYHIAAVTLNNNLCAFYIQMCQTGCEFVIKWTLSSTGTRTTALVTACAACDWSVSILAGYLNWESATNLHLHDLLFMHWRLAAAAVCRLVQSFWNYSTVWRLEKHIEPRCNCTIGALGCVL